MEGNANWTPPEHPEMQDGLSFGKVAAFVGGGLMLLVILAYFVIPWRDIGKRSAQIREEVTKASQQAIQEARESAVAAIQPPVQQETVKNLDTQVDSPAGLPPTRGFLVFRGQVVMLDKVDARISSDRKKVILLLNPKEAGDTGNIPALGVVLAFKNTANGCVPNDLEKFQLRIDMKPFNVGGERVVIIDRNPASKFMYQVNSMSCDRKTGGFIDLEMVGSSDIYDSDNIAWSFVLKGKIQ